MYIMKEAYMINIFWEKDISYVHPIIVHINNIWKWNVKNTLKNHDFTWKYEAQVKPS